VLWIAAGFLVGKAHWISGRSLRLLSDLVFLLLTPALLFRSMSTVHPEQLDFRPVAVYFVAAWLLFGAILASQGLNRRAAVLALAGTYSNSFMIGVTLIGLAYGPAGLVTLLTLVSVHALVMLTLATAVLELTLAREQPGSGSLRHLLRTVWLALRRTIIHPVPLPIIAGLLFAHTGWTMPAAIDLPLKLLGQAFGPLALLLVGLTLAGTPVGTHLRGALALAAAKNLAHPALVALLGWAFGLHGLPLAVMIVTAALPIGANVFFFSQRYHVAEELVTAGVAVSTLTALFTVSLVMLCVGPA
jgi:predicted permease